MKIIFMKKRKYLYFSSRFLQNSVHRVGSELLNQVRLLLFVGNEEGMHFLDQSTLMQFSSFIFSLLITSLQKSFPLITMFPFLFLLFETATFFFISSSSCDHSSSCHQHKMVNYVNS